MISPSRMKEPRQNIFSANTSAWRFVVGWNLKYIDVCGAAIVSPGLSSAIWCGYSNTNEMIGQLFPAKVLTMDEARGIAVKSEVARGAGS